MKRRTFIAGSAATVTRPALAGVPQSAQTLKFIPFADLRSLDPVWTTAYTTRNHGYMVYDTLYGQTGPEAGFAATPQMVKGHAVEDDGRTWRLTLRDDLMFHDGERVLARDCVASVKRWSVRDTFGQVLVQRMDELSALDDRTIVFRLKKPFPQLPEALGKWVGALCAIMPERLAVTDAYKQVTDAIGSGPYRFKADERVQGSLTVCEKFAGYRPREGGRADWTSGPKVAHFDRVEWHVIPDHATAVNALQTGEMDWMDYVTPPELVPVLERNRNIKTEINDPTGQYCTLRPNHLWPPFDNPAIRRALWGAIDQRQFMTATAGTDDAMLKVPVGFFTPGTPFASDVGMTVLTTPRDRNKVKEDLRAAGYQGEKVVLLVAADVATIKTLSDVAADMMTQAGINVDYQAVDFGTAVQRQVNKESPAKGGWNIEVVPTGGLRAASVGPNDWLRCNGQNAFFGWPSSPEIESLRAKWFDAADQATQKQIAKAIQQQAFIDVPYYPLGIFYQKTAYRANISGVLSGLPLFWNVHRA